MLAHIILSNVTTLSSKIHGFFHSGFVAHELTNHDLEKTSQRFVFVT